MSILGHPDGYHTLTPYLVAGDAAGLVAFMISEELARRAAAQVDR